MSIYDDENKGPGFRDYLSMAAIVLPILFGLALLLSMPSWLGAR